MKITGFQLILKFLTKSFVITSNILTIFVCIIYYHHKNDARVKCRLILIHLLTQRVPCMS